MSRQLSFALALLARRGALLLAAGFVALVMAGPLIPDEWFAASFYADPIILEFLAGMGLAKLYLSGKRIGRLEAIALLALAVAVAVAASGWPETPIVIAFGIPALLLAAAAILHSEAGESGPLRRFGEALGDASYALYLSHPFVVNGIDRLLGAGAGALIVALAASIAFALIFHRYIEAPVTLWLNRRAGERPRPLDDVAP